MRFPKPGRCIPAKDEMAGYLEAYADRFHLPVQLGTRADELARESDHYLIRAGSRRLKANCVIVATGTYPTPRLPPFAARLDPAITQLHSAVYRNPEQLPDGPVLVVGAGNSGVEIALDLAPRRRVWLAGRSTGFIPGHDGSLRYQAAVLIVHALAQRLTVDTPPGRWLVRRASAFARGHPVVGIRPDDLLAAGVERVPRVVGVTNGFPAVDGGQVPKVASIIWATGFVRDYRWIRLPVFDTHGEPVQHRGVVPAEPGLYFLGLRFQSSLLSGVIAGAGPDALYVINHLGARRGRGATAYREMEAIS